MILSIISILITLVIPGAAMYFGSIAMIESGHIGLAIILIIIEAIVMIVGGATIYQITRRGGSFNDEAD